MFCAGAQAQTPARTPEASLSAITGCRSISADAARLACYDAAAGALAAAETRGDIVVVGREQAEQVRRQAFGFALPSLSLFDRPGAGRTTAPLERITAVLASAVQRNDRRWILELEDGAIWTQTDEQALARSPRKGSTVEIRKAAMGSYFINVDGQRAIRANRSR